MSDGVRPAKRPSIYDVARRADVSHMTVSRVMNDAPSIKESTRARVLRAIADLDYRPSSVARALATRRAMRIGVVVHGATFHGPNCTLLAIEQAAREFGYSVSAYSASGDGDAEEIGGAADLLTHGIDALCVIGPRSGSAETLRTVAPEVPLVIVGEHQGDGTVMSVDADQAQGARAATEHLIGLGHRSIAHVTGPRESAHAAIREAAWRDALRSAGLDPGPVIVGDWSSESGFRAGVDAGLLGGATAVFAANDQMALGLIHGLWTRGIRVPDDVSIVGFDDIPGAAHFIPPLTTVRQDFDVLGRKIVEMLMSRMVGAPENDRHTIPTGVVVRGSTASVGARGGRKHPPTLPGHASDAFGG